MKPQITFMACLPRSRSAWVANFLSYGQSFAYHEPLRWGEVRRSDEAPLQGRPDWARLAEQAGTPYVTFCDTAFHLYWREALEAFPEARVLSVVRPRMECKIAWNKAVQRWNQPSLYDKDGLELMKAEGQLRALAHFCDREERPSVWMPVRRLDTMQGIEDLWIFCATDFGRLQNDGFNYYRARMLMDLNVEAILPRYIDDKSVPPKIRTVHDAVAAARENAAQTVESRVDLRVERDAVSPATLNTSSSQLKGGALTSAATEQGSKRLDAMPANVGPQKGKEAPCR